MAMFCKNNNYINCFLYFFICLTVVSLPFSIFLSDFSLSISGLLFLFSINKEDFKKFFFNKISLIFICWYLYLVSNSLFSKNVLLSLESTLFYFRFFIYSLSIYYCLETFNKFIKYFFLSLLLSFIIVLLDSYFQLLTGFNFFGYEYNNEWNRLSSFFNEEYILGSYISRILPIIIALFFYKEFKFKNKFFLSLCLIFLSVPIILFSGERTALLNLIIFFLIFIIIIDLDLKKILKTFILFFIFLFVFLQFNNDIKKRMVNYSFQQFMQGDSIKIFSIQHQLIYQTSFKIFLDNKIKGIGPKNFREVCKNYPSFSDLDKSVNGCSTNPHNIYIQLLTETGIIGFLFIATLFFFISFKILMIIFKKHFLNIYNDPSFSLLLIPCFISLWPFVPNGNFFNNWLNIIYFMPIGFLIFDSKNN